MDETLRVLGADLVPPEVASARGRGVLARQTDIYHASTTVEVATAVISTCVNCHLQCMTTRVKERQGARNLCIVGEEYRQLRVRMLRRYNFTSSVDGAF